jgi:hypothetical protein
LRAQAELDVFEVRLHRVIEAAAIVEEFSSIHAGAGRGSKNPLVVIKLGSIARSRANLEGLAPATESMSCGIDTVRAPKLQYT